MLSLIMTASAEEAQSDICTVELLAKADAKIAKQDSFTSRPSARRWLVYRAGLRVALHADVGG